LPSGGRREKLDKDLLPGYTSVATLDVLPQLLGLCQQALCYLKLAYDQRVDGVAQVEADHAVDTLAEEPAFRKLISDIGLPPLE
jgi:hypothetical protein